MVVTQFIGVNLNGTVNDLLSDKNGGKVIVPVSNFSDATVQIVPEPSGTGAAAWSSAIISVRRTNDIDTAPVVLESAVTLSSASTMTARIDTRGFAYLALVLTTVEGATLKANVYIATTNTGG